MPHETAAGQNIDSETVRDFGREWQRFHHQSADIPNDTIRAMFDAYFTIFPWERLPKDAVGFDAGCGSGRWAALVAPRVGRLICIDASADALAVARQKLGDRQNVEFHCASIDAMPIADGSMDFGYSLGVLHHMPDTAAGLRACVAKLKTGAPMMIYIYYAFDNRPAWFRLLWKASDVVRRVLSRAPFWLKARVADLLAATVYWPLARLAEFLEQRGRNIDALPLSAYRHRPFYVMRNDALDRFGTRLEFRMTRVEIAHMMKTAGLECITFSEGVPHWCAVGWKR